MLQRIKNGIKMKIKGIYFVLAPIIITILIWLIGIIPWEVFDKELIKVLIAPVWLVCIIIVEKVAILLGKVTYWLYKKIKQGIAFINEHLTVEL
jgi:hypothetical protein